MSEPLWRPDRQRVENANLMAFRRDLVRRGELSAEQALDDYPSLHRWSVEHLEAFWEAAWRDAAVETVSRHTKVLADRTMPTLRFEADRQWFPGCRFNFARHLLRYRDGHPAIIALGEALEPVTVTYGELYDSVSRCAAGLAHLGIGPRDRVAGYLPNCIEAIVAMLATTALGAVWSSTSPDFGFQGVLDRFGQIDPTVLICADGYRYNGKVHATFDNAVRLVREIPSIGHTVVVPFVGRADRLPEGFLTWNALMEWDTAGPEPAFPAFAFDHPVYIMFSSGTTGAPKCIVHGAGGTLLKHHVEHRFHTDLRRADRLFFFTTCGWMMWNWLVSGLAQGVTLVLYDGSPAYPGVDRLFRIAEEIGITVFGTSPKYLATCKRAGIVPRESIDLSPLRAILSTGAPLDRELFEWVYGSVKGDLQLASISGGTDILGCFMLGNPFQPVYAGEIQGPALGVDLAAFDDEGRSLVGTKGELVCRQPIPSMPIGFWNDPDGQKYREAYFSTYPGVWRHGDFIRINDRGGVSVFGRSDTTLNPGGVRIGTAELYRIVEEMSEVQDSIAVGQSWEGDVRILLFVVPAPGVELDDDLQSRIREAIRRHATPRHVPARIFPIAEVPVTVNGKKVELAVTRTLEGKSITNREALANPESLRQFEGLRFD